MFTHNSVKKHRSSLSFIKKCVNLVILCGFFNSCIIGGVYAQQGIEDIIAKIEITGLKSLTRDYVMGKIRSREGNYFYPSVVKEDIKRLYETGYFSMINFETTKTEDGVVLHINLEEKPILTAITFSGVHKLKEKDLKSEIKSTIGSPADEGRIKQDVIAIKNKYISKGYPLAEVNYRIDIVPEKNEATLKLIVDEGQRFKVKKIAFQGVKAFSQNELRKLLKTKKESIWPLNVLLKTGILDEEAFADDLDKIENFYHYKGYLDAKIVDVKRNMIPKQNKIEVIIVIEEGPTYNVGTIEITGNEVFPTYSLQSMITCQPKTLYSPEKLGKDVEAIKDFYFNRGYIDGRITSKVTFDPSTNAMNLSYKISEGSIYYINKINVQGNYRTKDKVIRRELVVYPGEVFHGDKIKLSQSRLENTGFFEKVTPKIENVDAPDRKNLVFDLEEKRTGALSFGAGFSSIDSFVGFVELSQSNFDLFNFKNFQGAGQKFRIRFEGGSERQDFLISFVEPYFLDLKLVFGVDLFYDKSDYFSDDYNESRYGVSFRLGKALSDFNRGDVILTIEQIDINVENDASAELRAEEGTFDQVSVGFKFDRDTRDRIIFPTRGAKTLALLKLAGGTASYTRLDFKRTYYTTPFSAFPKHIVQLTSGFGVAGGLSGENVPIFDRFFLGGPNTVRGFKYREIGPQDINDQALGGKLMMWGSAEYLVPIIERVYGALFLDGGNVYAKAGDLNGDVNVGTGLGLRLNLPIGPIRLDYGFPIVTDDFTDDEAKPRFHFSMGTSY